MATGRPWQIVFHCAVLWALAVWHPGLLYSLRRVLTALGASTGRSGPRLAEVWWPMGKPRCARVAVCAGVYGEVSGGC